ncbi:MAG: hypothetical protein JXR97_05665 [Planctomycetes bacterium]|nr:hypothetical protein [Planctomycetota bacterium]
MAEAVAGRPFFYGSSENRLNTKGQVALPKRFRDIIGEHELGQGFVLILGEGDCLYMYTHRQFGEVKERVRAIAVENGDAEFLRAFMEGAFAVDLDSQGRFVMPASLREEAGIKGPGVVFIGMDDRIEIWEPEKRAVSRGGQDEYKERRNMEAKRIFGL